MKLKYSHLSSGYIGEKNKKATLNSQYYNLFFNETINSYQNLVNILPFPQRVPRSGFFDELITLEVKVFKNKFEKIISMLISRYLEALEDLSYKSQDCARKFINYGKLLLRYGQFNTIMSNFPANYSGPNELEIKILRETSIIEYQLSNDENISVNNLLSLAKKLSHNESATLHERITLLQSIIVYFYRYQKALDKHDDIISCTRLLIELVDQLDSEKFIDKLYASIICRGLAMASNFDSSTQYGFIHRAEQFARILQGSTPLESIVAPENLYTCLQSLSKWSQNNNDYEMAESYLHEMIKIDPYDSTGYSELGFLYIKLNEYEKASLYFKNAMELGPPGTSMNAYYYAKCLEKTGQENEAIKFLYKSVNLDRQAISPCLDLLEYYTDHNHKDEAKQIAKYIYGRPVLMEQLNENEIKIIQNIIH